MTLDGSSSEPVFVCIARALVEEIRRGRLPPAARLPSSRALARTLGVHRNTVLAAYAELEQQGWIHTRPASGTFVVDDLPNAPPRRFAPRAAEAQPVSLDLPEPFGSGLELPGTSEPLLLLAGGVPDVRLIPHEAIARAYRRTLREAPECLSYGAARGDPKLIATLAAFLRETRGVVASPEDEVLVTRGSQMALHLAAKAVCPEGGVIAVEALGYGPAWEAFRLAGARLAAIPVDRSGLDVEALARLCRAERVRAVYVTPHHQYPTTVTMSASRRQALLALAREQRFVVLEDDYDHEHHFEGRPVLPLASADPARVVVYIGTLSKVLAPGLRVGFLIARSEIVQRASAVRLYLDRQGDHVVERALAWFIESGELERHVRRTRRAYLERREALASALQKQLGSRLSFTVPRGGLAFWVHVMGSSGTRAGRRSPPDVDAWAARARASGVLLQTARRFAFDHRARPYLRVGFPALTPAEIRRAVRLLAECAP